MAFIAISFVSILYKYFFVFYFTYWIVTNCKRIVTMNTEVPKICFFKYWRFFFMFNFFPAATEFVTVCHIKKQICQIWKQGSGLLRRKHYEKSRPQELSSACPNWKQKCNRNWAPWCPLVKQEKLTTELLKPVDWSLKDFRLKTKLNFLNRN